MKKLVAAMLALLAVAAFATAATASGPVSDEQVLCNVIDRGGGTVTTDNGRLIHYASGKVTLRCIAQGTPGSTIETTTGFLCGLGQFGLTTDSSNRVGKNGEIQLSCSGWSSVTPDAVSAAGGTVGAG
jgi:hypothetical protein